MAMEWNNNLSTGVMWQDRQHKELFKRVNKLLDAMTVGLGKEEVGRLLKFLDEYFVVHFEAEEQAMTRCDYPDAVAHLSEHTRFIEDVSRLEAEAEAGASTTLVMQTQSKVVDWFINHIGEVDKKLGECILKADSARKGKG
ncbi:MAG: hemerythrin family protein [Deltaproteobacteria bacterium]|nr:hemerythrin family protein [Deltaproteobacteria bacterium]